VTASGSMDLRCSLGCEFAYQRAIRRMSLGSRSGRSANSLGVAAFRSWRWARCARSRRGRPGRRHNVALGWRGSTSGRGVACSAPLTCERGSMRSGAECLKRGDCSRADSRCESVIVIRQITEFRRPTQAQSEITIARHDYRRNRRTENTRRAGRVDAAAARRRSRQDGWRG